jgi:hypothetical protein
MFVYLHILAAVDACKGVESKETYCYGKETYFSEKQVSFWEERPIYIAKRPGR